MPFIIGAAILGGTSLVGGIMGSNAASSAANAQVQGTENATQAQLSMFNAIQALEGPGRNLGYGSDALLAQLFGMPNPNTSSGMYPANAAAANFTGGGVPSAGVPGVGGATAAGKAAAAPSPAAGPPNFSNFFNTPGYQFTLQQGENAINRAASAGGNLYSTNTLTNLNNYAQGAASTQYNNYVGQLMQMAGLGAGAVNSTASAGTTAGNNISANLLSAGNANASGILGSTGALTGGLNSAAGAFGNSVLLSSLLGGGGSGVSYAGMSGFGDALQSTLF